jgi:hypothetical protein
MQTTETMRRNEAVLQIPGAGSKTRKTWGARGDWRVVGPDSLCSSRWPARAPIVTCDASRWHSLRVGESGPGRSARWLACRQLTGTSQEALARRPPLRAAYRRQT